MAKNNNSQPHSDDFPITPRPRTSLVTVILCVFNVLAATGFLYLLKLDLEKRRAFTRASFLTDVAIYGIPLAQEDKGPAGVKESEPKPNLPSDDLKEAYTSRKPGGGPVKEAFIAQDDIPPPRITPKDLDEDKLRDIFGDPRNGVTTLEDEVRRVQQTILQDIRGAAEEGAKADAIPPADKKAEPGKNVTALKRQRLEITLLAQTVDAFELAELRKTIAAIADDKLDEWLTAAHERRMILDILRPIEYHRWGDPNRPYLNLKNTTGLDGLNLKELRNKLTGRLENSVSENYAAEFFHGKDWDKKREAFEKRANIASLLFTIAHVQKPDGKLLYENGAERTQTVLGLFAFAAAANDFTEAVDRMNRRLIEQILHDREGSIVTMNKEDFKKFIDKYREGKKGDEKSLQRLMAEYDALADDGIAPVRTPAFTDHYEDLISAIRQRLEEINRAKISLELKKKQRDEAEQAFLEGEADVLAKEAELRAERAKTAKLLVELQALNDRLFRFQRELTTAAEINEALARRIREIEEQQLRNEGLLPPKGQEP